MVRHQACVKIFIVCLALTSALVAAQEVGTKTIVRYPSAFAISRPLSEMPIDEMANQSDVLPVRPIRPSPLPGAPVIEDSALQKLVLPNVGATKGVDFDGVGAAGFAPSDSDMAVGPNHILEGVNVRLAVFSKAGAVLAGPTNFTTFFSALGGPCALGASDPIMLYDRMADRWLVSDIGISGTFAQCVGISKTNDPTGAYFLYSFSFGTNLNDYPKLSTWATTSNSAYLATYNIFQNAQIFIGADLCGMDRTKMLAGNPGAAQICKMTPNNDGGYLPSDMDGPTPPTDGTPGLFITWNNNNPGELFLRKLTLNFAAGTATLSAPASIAVANFALPCGSCVPQLGTTQTLDTLGGTPMNRFPVRHFPDHDRAILTHVVGSGAQVAERWYELFDPAGAVTVNQQGTFAPDTTFRWMGSMAEDKLGDIAIGYSASSTAIHPAIRFTGRVPSDPAGTLETEASILEGTGSQTGGLSRWGDYTAMVVDPTDDCTFWYVNQYEKVNGSFNWSTHIGSFVFPTCSGAPTPAVTLSATKLSFPKTVIGVTSAPKSVTLTNSGTAILHISSITASGDFAISNNTCGPTVAVGASCSVSVTFTPTNKGTRKGNLTFTDDAPTSPQIVALVGTGTAIKLTPTSLNFGTVVVGQTSASQTVTVTNVAAFLVTFTSFTLGGVAPGDYLITNNTCGPSLAGGASCSVSVAFKPTLKGKRNAMLKVADNGGGSPQTAKLTGVGG